MDVVLLYLLFTIGGVVIEAFATRAYFRLTKKRLHKPHFKFARYLFLLTFPLLGTIIVINLQGLSLLRVFLIFLIIGPIFEWVVGFSYYQVVGVRLWTYSRLTFLGHTSLLAAPLWGFGGVLAYLISKMFA